MGTRVCFLLGALGPSGGAGAVVRHALGLAREQGMDVTIAVASADGDAPVGVPVIGLAEARAAEYDVAISTWWRTAYDLFSIPARRRVHFVQQLEERVYRPGDVERLGAAAVLDLPVAFVTEARWIAELIAELRPGAPCFRVPNGIDADVFHPAGRRAGGGPLRVLVEGSPGLWYKGVADAARVLARATEPLDATLVTPEAPDPQIARSFDRVMGPFDHAAMAEAYRDADVLLKLSRVEGVFMPPIEALSCGTTCVVWPVTGHDEVVHHGVDGVVVDFDDVPGTAGWLDLLARDRALLDRLRRGALETAAGWPSWSDSTARFAEALERVVAAPPPPAADAAPALLADLDAAMEEQRLGQRRLMRELEIANRRLAALEPSVRARSRWRRH
jgi:glycosyltransferase involved in cell wall biosynthesis